MIREVVVNFDQAWGRAGGPRRDNAALIYLAQRTALLPTLVYFDLHPDELSGDDDLKEVIQASRPLCAHRRLLVPTERQDVLVAMETVTVTPDCPLYLGVWGGCSDAVVLTVSIEGGHLITKTTRGGSHITHSLKELALSMRPHLVATEWPVDGVPLRVPHAMVTAVDAEASTVRLAIDRYSRQILVPIAHVC